MPNKAEAQPESTHRNPLKDLIRHHKEKEEVKDLKDAVSASAKLEAVFTAARDEKDAEELAAEAHIDKKEALGWVVLHRAEREAALDEDERERKYYD